jgi:AcrR family transcriptional regulator
VSSQPAGLGHPRGVVPHDRRLDDVLSVATGHFRRKGFRATRLDDISEGLGVSRAALYHYFDGKQALLEEICARAMTSSEVALREVEALEAPHERLLSFAKVYARNMSSDAAQVFARNIGELSPGFRDELRSRMHGINVGAAAIFEYGISRGEFRSDLQLRHTTLGFLGMLNSLAERQREPHGAAFDALVEELVSIYVLGVAQRPPGKKQKGSTA